MPGLDPDYLLISYSRKGDDGGGEFYFPGSGAGLLPYPTFWPPLSGGNAMRKQRRTIIRALIHNRRPVKSTPPDPWALEPDELRHQVQQRLAGLGEADGRRWRQNLITGLAEFGVSISSPLFMLGIVVTHPDELTASDMGMLLRYFRINSPAAIKGLAEPLAELLVAGQAPAFTGQHINKAA